jgi:hypothetical protein
MSSFETLSVLKRERHRSGWTGGGTGFLGVRVRSMGRRESADIKPVASRRHNCATWRNHLGRARARTRTPELVDSSHGDAGHVCGVQVR